ncbi:MAG TPA: S8 family serine peptidase, partial [Micromonosporaceae bacterium]|nr:S8 family serine peptidase [Micromonosporaceae bacterium]
ARGAGVISTYVTVDGFSGWARWSGTSFAAPQVAAAIAIQVKKNPQKTPKQVAADMLGSGSGALPAWPNPADGNPAAKLYVSDVDLTT